MLCAYVSFVDEVGVLSISLTISVLLGPGVADVAAVVVYFVIRAIITMLLLRTDVICLSCPSYRFLFHNDAFR